MALGSTSVLAQSREYLRGLMKTSLFGRRSGMDVNDYEVGEQDTRLPVDNISTTIGSSLAVNGASVLSCTSASSSVNTMLGAVAGIYKQITQISSSTLGVIVQVAANGNIVTTQGSSFNQMVFQGVGHCVSLFCASTAGAIPNNGPVWLCSSPASPGLAFSTY